jgi:hypothetical protein
MNRVLGRCLAGLVIATGALAVVTSACVHDDSSFFVQAAIYPQPQGSGTCTYTANPSQNFISHGTLDVAFARQYRAVFLLANQLVAQSNPNQVQTETANINVQGAIVRDTDAAGNQLDKFTSLTSGTVYAAVGGTPGYSAIDATVVSPTAAGAAGNGKTVVAYIKFYGHTLGGQYIESNEFEYPVDICNGCLIQFSAADINTCYQNIPNCEGAVGDGGTASTSTGGSQAVPCHLGQDTLIDCSQCLLYPACRPNPGAYICATDAGAGG